MAFFYYHPQSTAKLGLPLDARKPFDDKTTNGYFDWKNYSIDNSNVGASIEFSLSEITSRKELYEKMSLDLSVEAKFGLSSAKASLEWEKEYKYDDKTIVFLFYGKKIYNPETISGVLEFSQKGKDAWKNAVKKKKIVQFQRTAGTDVVTKIQRGNIISLVYTFRCTSETSRNRVKAKLDAGWATGNVSIDFKKELSSLDETMSVQIEGFQSGVSNNKLDPRITDIINISPGDIVEVKKVVSQILGNVSEADRNSSPIMELNTREISDITEIALSDHYDEFVFAIELNKMIDSACIELSEQALRNSKKMEDMKLLEDSWNKADFKTGSLKTIQDKIVELKDQKSKIYTTFKNCIGAQKESDCDVNIPSVEALWYTDVLVSPLVLPLPWQGFTTATNTAPEHGTFRTLFYPVIHIKYSRAIKGIFVLKQNVRQILLNKAMIQTVENQEGSLRNIWYEVVDSYNVYVWGWIDYLVAQAVITYHNAHISSERGIKYELEIILDDGSSQMVNIGNVAEPAQVPEEYFENLPQDVIDEIEKSEIIKVVRKKAVVEVEDKLLQHQDN